MKEAYRQWARKVYVIWQVLHSIRLPYRPSICVTKLHDEMWTVATHMVDGCHFDPQRVLRCESSDGWLDKTHIHIGGIRVHSTM